MIGTVVGNGVTVGAGMPVGTGVVVGRPGKKGMSGDSVGIPGPGPGWNVGMGMPGMIVGPGAPVGKGPGCVIGPGNGDGIVRLILPGNSGRSPGNCGNVVGKALLLMLLPGPLIWPGLFAHMALSQAPGGQIHSPPR